MNITTSTLAHAVSEVSLNSWAPNGHPFSSLPVQDSNDGVLGGVSESHTHMAHFQFASGLSPELRLDGCPFHVCKSTKGEAETCLLDPSGLGPAVWVRDALQTGPCPYTLQKTARCCLSPQLLQSPLSPTDFLAMLCFILLFHLDLKVDL